MSDHCDKCGRVPPQGQRLLPVTRKDPVSGHYVPGRECSACIAAPRRGVRVRRTIFIEKRGARLVGTTNPFAKLEEHQVREIIRLYRRGNVSQRELATKYGIGQSTVGGILRGKKWRHVSEALA